MVVSNIIFSYLLLTVYEVVSELFVFVPEIRSPKETFVVHEKSRSISVVSRRVFCVQLCFIHKSIAQQQQFFQKL